MKFQGSKFLAKVCRAKQKHDDAVGELERYLADKIEFDFAVDYQPSDGHMILDLENAMRIAPAAECLSVIYRKGSLSREEHEKLCI